MSAQTIPQPTLVERALLWARQRGPGFLVEALVNFLLPFLIFTFAKRPLGEVGAMMAASGAPIAWSILEFARHRRLDALSLIVLAGIALSLIAFVGGGGVKFLQLREHLVGAVIGLVFLGSAALGRPLIDQLARARMKRAASAVEREAFASVRDHPIVRRATLVMTLAWGFGLIAESVAAGVLVFVLPVGVYLIVSPIIGTGSIVALTAWTFWYARRRAVAARAVIAAS